MAEKWWEKKVSWAMIVSGLAIAVYAVITGVLLTFAGVFLAVGAICTGVGVWLRARAKLRGFKKPR
jgi:hypothetical protein